MSVEDKNNNKNRLRSGRAIFQRNCERATTEPVTGVVRGEIPSWLEGTLIRNGPGVTKIGTDEYNHVFDGLSVLHRFHIEKGLVTYTSRPLESDSYKANMAAQRIVVGEFGTVSFLDPCKSLFQRLQSTFSSLKGNVEMTDNCNVNVAYYGDQLYALTETKYIRRIDPQTLETLGEKENLKDYIAVNHATAHPHILPDGSALNLGSNFVHKHGPHYCIVKIPPASAEEEGSALTDAKIIAEIPMGSMRNFSYYHSFGITASNKLIFIESPLQVNLFTLLTTELRGLPPMAALTWNPKLKTKFHVVSMEDGKQHPVVYESEPFFTFHHINAFEEDGQIVVDLIAYDDPSCTGVDLVPGYESNNNSSGLLGFPRRFVLPLNPKVSQSSTPGENLVTLKGSTAKAMIDSNARQPQAGAKVLLEPEQLSEVGMELPRINYEYNGKRYNFIYGVSKEFCENGQEGFGSITKIDTRTKEVTQWIEYGMEHSEPVFVPDPNGTSEDDGVLLSAAMHAGDPNAATLLILNAKNLEELAKVDFRTTGEFTTTFHGNWAGHGEKFHFY